MSLKLEAIFRFWLLIYSVASYPINENYGELDINNLFENDIAISTINNNNTDFVLGAAWKRAVKWSGKTVPYVISFYGHSKQQKVRQAMNEIERKTCLRFVRRNSEESYLNFIQDPNSKCYSYVGKQSGQQDLSLSDGCLDDHDSVLHELMHALGFLHEQNRHDRDSHITINWSLVSRMGMHNESMDWKKRDRSELSYFNTDYDYTSVMHYPETIGGMTVITPKKNGARIESNGLSRNDVHRINRLYECNSGRRGGDTGEGDNNGDENDGGRDGNDRRDDNGRGDGGRGGGDTGDDDNNGDENDGGRDGSDRRDGNGRGDDRRDGGGGRRDNRRNSRDRDNDQDGGSGRRENRRDGNGDRGGNYVVVTGNNNVVITDQDGTRRRIKIPVSSNRESNRDSGRFIRGREQNRNTCQHGVFYCGSELLEMNYRNTRSRDLYYCFEGRAFYTTTCVSGCLRSFGLCDI